MTLDNYNTHILKIKYTEPGMIKSKAHILTGDSYSTQTWVYRLSRVNDLQSPKGPRFVEKMKIGIHIFEEGSSRLE